MHPLLLSCACRLSPDRVLIVMTQRLPSGLRFNPEDMAFQPEAVPGSTAAWAAGSVGASVVAVDPQQVRPWALRWCGLPCAAGALVAEGVALGSL